MSEVTRRRELISSPATFSASFVNVPPMTDIVQMDAASVHIEFLEHPV
jgi:hypothetical protein